MQFELVVFDIAGTTMVDDHAVSDSLRAALRAADVGVTEAEVNAVMGLAKPRAIRALLERRDPGRWADADIARIHDHFVARMVRHYETCPDVREVHGMTPAFLRLRAMGIKVALDTGFSRPIVDAILARLGWAARGLVDACVTSDEVRRGRPYPDMIQEAMRRTRTTGIHRVIKVGDTPADIQEGAAAGCPVVIGVTNGTHVEEELRAHPCTFIIATAALVPELIRRIETRPPASIAFAWSE